jgi:hypothetical protein
MSHLDHDGKFAWRDGNSEGGCKKITLSSESQPAQTIPGIPDHKSTSNRPGRPNGLPVQKWITRCCEAIGELETAMRRLSRRMRERCGHDDEDNRL